MTIENKSQSKIPKYC